MIATTTTKLTARQFLELPEDVDGARTELADGEVVMSPSANMAHSHVDMQLRSLLLAHIHAKQLGFLFGDLDTVLSEFNVRRPDILFVAAERRKFFEGGQNTAPPDLCIEIVSPSSVKIDRQDKFEQYARSGVANYWIVDYSQRTLEVFVLQSSAYSLAVKGVDADVISPPPFPELQLPLAQIWPEPWMRAE